MIKAIFFDMDGTLLSHSLGDVPASARRCLSLLRQKGILCFMATGRHLLELNNFPLADLEFDGYITVNGQLVLDSNRKLLFGSAFSEEAMEKLSVIFRENRFPLVLVEENRMYLNYVDENVVQAQADIQTPIPPLGSWEGDAVYHGSIYLREHQLANLRQMLGDSCRLVGWYDCAVDVIPKEGGKVDGIQKIMERFGLTREEIMAFGDGENDRDMLLFAGIGVAMGNGKETVKAAADYVTDHIDQDGVEKALIHFGLI